MRHSSPSRPNILGQLTAIIRGVDAGLDVTARAVLRLGLERLGLSIGMMSRIEGERYTVEQVVQAVDMDIEVGQVFDLGQTYCREVVRRGQTIGQHHVSDSSMREHPAYKALGLESYLGVPLIVNGRAWGTLSFSSPDVRPKPFSTEDIEAIELLATWLGAEIGRQELVEESEKARQHAVAMAERFEAFTGNTPALTWAVDEQERYIYMNASYARVMQIDPATAIGKRPDEVLSAETLASLQVVSRRTNRQARESDGVVSFHVEMAIGGKIVPVYVSKFVFQDQDGRRMVGGSAIDMSEISRIETELLESEERFRQAIDHAPIGLGLVAPGGKWLRVNSALCDLLGYSADELLKLDFQALTHAEDLDKDRELIDQVLNDKIKSYQVDKRYLHREGRLVWARLSVSLVRSPKTGEPLYFIAQIEDITKQRAYETELAHRNSDLKALLYVISHDLREPLRAIRNFSGIVKEDYADRIDERGQDMLARVIRGAERLDALLADVLVLSRAQRADLLVAPIPSRPVVDAVVAELQPVIEETGAKVEIDSDLPTIVIDERWLKRVVYNLLSNALKFTSPGRSPEVRVSAYQPDASRSHPQRRRQVGLVFSDRGPGVPEELRGKVFGLFQRGVGREVPGTGAGLAIVAQIAGRYGGRAWIEDREGGGARFVVTFNYYV